MNRTEQEIRNSLAASINKAAARVGPEAKSAARPIFEEVVRSAVPTLVNQMNAEGPFRSRVIIGSLTAIVGGGFGLYDLAIEASRDASAYAMNIAIVAGGAYALYGRLTTRPAIGASPAPER